jgi:hypothetical protein
MGPLSWFRKRRREHTRTEIERLVELDCPAGPALDRLRRLLDWTFRNSARSDRAMIARARRRGVSPERIDSLRAGEVAAEATWDQISTILWACGAPSAAIEVARDLFRDVRRAGPRLDSTTESWTGQHCSVLLTDVVDFGAQTRTDQDRKAIREAMYRIVREAFIMASISWDACHHEDRGDGILLVIPPREPTRRIVHPLLTHIIGELSRHNARAQDSTSFQLRVALDVGPVESDDEGVNGKVIIDVARLIDASAFKQKLAKAPPETSVGFIASDSVYDSIIKQHPGQLAPAEYQKINPRVKGDRITAWIKLASGPGAVSGKMNP